MLQKYDVINGLATRFRLARLLEISTPTTGFTFREAIDNPVFDACHRLIYRCPEEHDDGLPITFRTPAEFSSEITRRLYAEAGETPAYDIVFVDPFHTYKCTFTDLTGAWMLLRPGGYLVIHDCNPTNPRMVTPEYVHGAWCGVTYQAYIDFILSGVAAAVFTVDSDFGIGVMHKPVGAVTRMPIRDKLFYEWSVARDQNDMRYACFDRHREELLNLISEEQFRRGFGIDIPRHAAAQPA